MVDGGDSWDAPMDMQQAESGRHLVRVTYWHSWHLYKKDLFSKLRVIVDVPPTVL